jgi:hypothetical protein
MIVEIFLLMTALVFTGVGYWMGKENGMQAGINGTLAMLDQQKLIKVTEMPNGEVNIERAE